MDLSELKLNLKCYFYYYKLNGKNNPLLNIKINYTFFIAKIIKLNFNTNTKSCSIESQNLTIPLISDASL